LTYKVLIEEEALEFLTLLTQKSNRIVKERCQSLAEDPFPGQSGDREALHLSGHRKFYRMHVARSYTIFYQIYNDEKVVRILAITTIEQAHKMYGQLDGIFD
jgi:mRNA interferase RelE/StbE